MKKLYAAIASLPFMAFLFLALGFVMAAATFIESSYGTPAARSLIYRSWWFELLWALLALNLINNIFKYRLYRPNKLPLGIFHAAFLLILLGAVVTRYISYEGKMHIREGEKTNLILSAEDYFSAGFGGETKREQVIFSELTPGQFSAGFGKANTRLKIKSVGFVNNAERMPVASVSGGPIIDFVYSTPGSRGMQVFHFEKGSSFENNGFSAGFEAGDGFLIRFFNRGPKLFMVSGAAIGEMAMPADEKVTILAGDTIEIKKMFLYQIGDCRFLIREFYEKAKLAVAKSQTGDSGESAVLVRVDDGSTREIVPVFGHSGIAGDTVSVEFAGNTLKMVYGAIPKTIPFELFLKDFQLEKYPGSDSPSSYCSEVRLFDSKTGVSKEFRIFMNNTLYYGGFKFFQSSFDTDQKGTILSVSHDFWGTTITYFGYFLMIVGFILSLISPHSYFRKVIKRLKKSQLAGVLLILSLVLGSNNPALAQVQGENPGIPEIGNEVVGAFGKLWVQGRDGRIEPVSTLSGELVRKISRKSSFSGKTSDEIVLGFMVNPDVWRKASVIKISDKNIASELGARDGYVSFDQFFDSQRNYKIIGKVNEAYNKPVSFRNKSEKEYINIDERVNICYMLMRGSFLNIFPSTNLNEPWHVPETVTLGLPENDSLFVRNGISQLVRAISENNKKEALQVIAAIGEFQKKYGNNLLPSGFRRDIEIGFNKINPFKRLFPFYLLTGFLLLLVLFVNIFRQKKISPVLRNIFYTLIILLFAAHTLGLAARWIISGHAPWSNGYESMVYVAWAALSGGLIFGRKYPMVVATAAFLSGISLFVAHLSWMNPEVTNLVPVLKSYWLTFHVAIITASYGFIGLSAFLGILVLILIVLKNKTNSEAIKTVIGQLTSINELSVMVGLYFLTIGSFLGGVWANESWGRYWGWDPKETWALITIMIYAFIAHMRLVPSLKGYFSFNVATVIGFSSVLMTYFGVNYYLSGLHSYGKGVAEGIQWPLILGFGLTAVLIIAAKAKYKKAGSENQPEMLPEDE